MTPRPGRYFWKLFVANAVVMGLVLVASVWFIVAQLDRLREEELSRHLFAQASALEVAVRDRFDRGHASELNAIAQQIGSTERKGIRITFILADGKVVGDSEANAPEMESHADRPEVRQALANGRGESLRWSHTVAKNMQYVAARVGPADKPLGVVRVSMAVESIAARVRPARRLVLTIVLVSVCAAILLAAGLALLWSRRIQRVTEVAKSISDGDLSARVPVVGHDELAVLGRSLNEMREKLSNHLDTIDRQRRTLESLVSRLGEGVVVADAENRIVLMNTEAIEMLCPAPLEPGGSYVGRPIEQCVPHHKLQDLMLQLGWESAAYGDRSSTGVHEAGERRLQEHAQEIELRLSTETGYRTALARAFDVRLPGTGESGSTPTPNAQVGRALVLTDITELTKVMQVKADLAANASHELRTPLSAIRAAIDTLSAIDVKDDSEALCQLIDVIDRHSARMDAMIGDLLKLSRLESGAEQFEMIPISGRAVLEELSTTFADAVAAKNLRWSTSISNGDVTLTTSRELLRLILHNLIDNAIRFTDSGGEIKIAISSQGEKVSIAVIDTGCGIPRGDHRRVFERFYQVEQARSGSNRGTGLGLSIVRHAAVAMNAHLDLQSSIGKGTRIMLEIPSRP